MAYVGEVILGAREMMTDMPQVYPPPSQNALALAAGTSLPVGTFFVVVTLLTIFGETLPSNEQSITTTPGNQNLTVTILFPGSFTNLVAARIYIGTASGAENQYLQVPVPLSGILSFNATTTIIAQPPSLNTARLPDTDGQAVGAFTIYRWLNQALGWAAAKNRGGLPDFGAAGTIGGQPNYTLPGYWKKLDTAWYDGYPLGLLAKTNVFRRNPVTGYAGMLTVFQATDRLMVELWPQPSRTSAQTTLASGMGATDTTAALTSTASYVLGFGMTQIDSEIVNFSAISGNSLIGLQRGMCGTVPVAHSASAPVTELNLMVAGFRVPSTYAVGQSVSTLYLPPGWDEALISYIMYRFRKAEQDEQGAAAYLKEATQKMSDLGANRIIAGPRQITPFGGAGPEIAAGMGSRFGGIIVP